MHAGRHQQQAVDAKHQCQADVRHHYKTTQLDDVLQVGTRHHLGHQRQYAVGGELHHQPHQAHHPRLQHIDGSQRTIAFFSVVLEQLQRRDTQKGCKNHHADDRRRLRTGHIGHRILRNERQQQLRHIDLGDLVHIVVLQRLHARHLLSTSNQALGGEAEQVGERHADQRCNQRGEQQRADGQKADAPKR